MSPGRRLYYNSNMNKQGVTLMSNYLRTKLKITEGILNHTVTKKELNDLVQDCFPDVYHQFTDKQNKEQKVRLLIEYVDNHERVELLIEKLKSISPEINEKYESILEFDRAARQNTVTLLLSALPNLED